MRVWHAGSDDWLLAAQLLHDFNVEFDEPTPSPGVLAGRLRELVSGGDTVVLLAGTDTGRATEVVAAVAVLRLRGAIWTDAAECYLAELYVVPPRRRQGIGRVLMQAAMSVARERGATSMEISVDEPDAGARALYESFGFSNRCGPQVGPTAPVMYVYERDI